MNGMVAALVKKLRPSNGPPQPSSKSVDGIDLGGGWKECIDTRPGAPSYGRTFFFNTATLESSWRRPPTWRDRYTAEGHPIGVPWWQVSDKPW